jgi:hypothetical protein
MESYIQYKRFVIDIVNNKEETPEEQIESFFKTLVAGGWTMIHYNEKIAAVDKLQIVVVAGKKQTTIL